jgi:hypothetical protein
VIERLIYYYGPKTIRPLGDANDGQTTVTLGISIDTIVEMVSIFVIDLSLRVPVVNGLYCWLHIRYSSETPQRGAAVRKSRVPSVLNRTSRGPAMTAHGSLDPISNLKPHELYLVLLVCHALFVSPHYPIFCWQDLLNCISF